MNAKIIVALCCKPIFTPGRLQGRRAQNVLDRDAEPISTFLCIGQVRVDKAFLPRLGLVRPACCRLSDSVLAAAALIAHPPTAPRAARRIARLVGPIGIGLLQRRGL